GRRRHTRFSRDWSSDVCSSDLAGGAAGFSAIDGASDMNAIMAIHPYRHHGLWVFDDPAVGLLQEPFVAGADAIIDRAVAQIPDEIGRASCRGTRKVAGAGGTVT